MEGRTSEVEKANREARVDRVASADGEKAPEVTRFLHQLVTEVARVHRGDSEASFSSSPCSREELAAVELPPFRAAIDAGADLVMSGHVALPAVTHDSTLPATLSRAT